MTDGEDEKARHAQTPAVAEFRAPSETTPLEFGSGDTIFEAIEGSTRLLSHDRSSQFRRAAEAYQREGKLERQKKMLWEWMAFSLGPCRNGEALFGGKRFAPFAMWTSQDGRLVRQPDEELFTPDVIAHYEQRAEETQNPIHRARYYDIVWERRRDHRFARSAFEAYVALIPVYLSNDWGLDLGDAVERCLTLALHLSDRSLVQRAVDGHLATLESLRTTGRYRWYLELLRSLLTSAHKVTDLVNWDFVAAFGEEAAAHFAAQGNGLLERQFLEGLAAVYRQLERNDMAVQTRARIAESFERTAAAQFGNEGGALGVLTFLQSALKIYMDLGAFPEPVEELKGQLKSAGAEARRNMKRMASSVTIPRETIERVVKWVKPLPLEQALRELAQWNGWIPSYAAAKQLAEENASRFPLSNLATVQVMRNDNPALQIQSDAEKIEYHAVQHITMTYTFLAQVTLAPVFDLLKTKGLTAETLCAHFSHSNLFTPERLELVGRGLERYFAGDYVSALHILPIQLEGMIRDIAALLTVPTTSKTRRRGLQERQLEDLLAEESIRGAFGQDFVTLLATFLIDQRGTNLRHDVAHALLPPQAFQRWAGDLLLMIFMHVSSYRLKRQEKHAGTHSIAEPPGPL